MRVARLVLHQLRFTNRAFWRNPFMASSTFALPLMFLVIFTGLLGGGDVMIGGTPLRQSTYFVGTMSAFGVISACYTNIAIGTTFSRDGGVLKRLRGTPLPPYAYLAARILHGMFVGALLVALTLAFGRLVYDSPIPEGSALLRFTVTFLVGSLSFAALGLAVTAAVPNADAAPAVVNASILPLLFLSGIFIPLGDDTPRWMVTASDVFPVGPFAEAMRAGFLGNVTRPGPTGPVAAYPFEWSSVLNVALWGLAGFVLAARYFSWQPRR